MQRRQLALAIGLLTLLQACEAFGMPGRCVSIGAGDHGVKIRSGHEVAFHLPPRPGHHWQDAPSGRVTLGPRGVAFVVERPGGPVLRRRRGTTP